jgi:hypothetical protein
MATAPIAPALKKLMHARIVAEGGDFAARTTFTEADFAAAALQRIERQQCVVWMRHLYERYAGGDERKLYLMVNELSEDEVCICAKAC